MNEQSFSTTGKAGAVMLMVFAVIAGLLWVVSEANLGSAVSPGPSATPDVTNQRDICWEVSIDGNDAGDRVISAGLSGSPEKVQAVMLKAAKEDPSALVALYNMSPLAQKKSLSEKDVATDGCFTAAGKQAWLALVAEMNKPAVKTVNQTAPKRGCNTYVKDGKVVVKCETILGNRKATKIIWGDGSVTWVLHRCGNPMTPGLSPFNPPKNPPGNPPSGPKCPDGTPVPSNGLCPKDPSEDPLVNPDVPDQVKGPGTTPPGGNPGKPEKPVDSPTGCDGKCPGGGSGGGGNGGGDDSPLPDPTEPPEPGDGNPDDPVGGDQDPPPPPD